MSFVSATPSVGLTRLPQDSTTEDAPSVASSIPQELLFAKPLTKRWVATLRVAERMHSTDT